MLLASVNSIYAQSVTKTATISCSGGTASEKVKLDVTLETLSNPKYSYSESTHTDSIGMRWSGFSHKPTKSTVGDTATYNNKVTATWIDYNYVTASNYKNLTWKYVGTLQ